MRAAITAAAVAVAAIAGDAQGRGGAPPAGPPPTPKAGALVDLTGYWVSLVTEDWRYRQFMPAKGDYAPIPLNAAGRRMADAWDPAKDDAAGEPCRAYGAAGIMRMPTRLRITWQDDAALKLEADAGTQTRIFRFGKPQGTSGSLQGVSTASWDQPRALFGSPIPLRGGPELKGGSLKVVTTNMKPGYLRKNGVPHSAAAVLTEYFDRLDVPGGDTLVLVTAELVDPEYLTTPYWTSTHFRRQNDAAGWRPTPCTVR
ncbi:MAG: hypothetical protein HY655_11170 [Acidobacteria bacterium]|nr:hypothetical protein [Acidobacteriota bacterium]